jgi:hypothetical protein
MNVLNQFESLPDIVLQIDVLMFDATHAPDRKTRIAKAREAKSLADAYQQHCEIGGNNAKQFSL